MIVKMSDVTFGPLFLPTNLITYVHKKNIILQSIEIYTFFVSLKNKILYNDDLYYFNILLKRSTFK